MTQRIERALVTGASSGIGEAFARQLAKRHIAVVLVARRQERLQRLAEELGDNTEVIVADLTTQAGIRVVSDRLRDQTRPVDLLVNNAGVGLYGPISDHTGERAQSLIRLNIEAVVALTSAHVSELQTRPYCPGGIINVGSLAGELPTPYATTYGASKAFIRSYTYGLHEELRGTGIRVLLCAPGVTESEFGAASGLERRRTLPSFVKSSSAEVVEHTLKRFTAGEIEAMHKRHNRLVRALARILPGSLVRSFSARAHRTVVGD